MAAQDLATAEALARLLDLVLPKEDVILLVTSDMSHCGPLYGNLPRSQGTDANDIIKWCKQQRRLAVEAIESMDAAYMVDTFNVQMLSMCGVGCVATAILFARLRGAAAARVLAVSDSVEVAVQWRGHVPLDSFGKVISPWDLLCEVDPRNPVGFAAIALL
jgi:AmmeMemoRadiSam system protein B